MKKRVVFVFLVIVVFSLLVGCGDKVKTLQVTEESDDKVKTLQVTRETGLYSSFKSDAEQLDVLSVGTVLIPVGENLICTTNLDGIRTCNVEVENTGLTGWVLEKAIDYR